MNLIRYLFNFPDSVLEISIGLVIGIIADRRINKVHQFIVDCLVLSSIDVVTHFAIFEVVVLVEDFVVAFIVEV